MKKYTIFIGNPGTGKSSLLNALLGKIVFRSGISYGEGLTTFLQLQQASGCDYYGDTPGLSDVKMREKAAAEISRALRSGHGDYKIVFVVTEEAGRLRPADGATMKVVLDALPKDRRVPFGIIVNKVSKRMKQELETDQEKFVLFAACLNKSHEHRTAYIHLYPEIEELEDADDKLHEPKPALRLWLDMLPSVHIKPDEVQDVTANEIDVQIRALNSQLEDLNDYNKALEITIESDREEIAKQFAVMEKTHDSALTEVCKESQKQMKQLDEKYSIQMIAEWEETCCRLEQEYLQLLTVDVRHDEDLQLAHAKCITKISKRLEEAQFALAELRSTTMAVSDRSSHFGSSTTDSSSHSLERRCDELQRRYDEVMSEEVPENEDSQVRYAQARSRIGTELEAAQMQWAEISYVEDGAKLLSSKESFEDLQREFVHLNAVDLSSVGSDDAVAAHLMRLTEIEHTLQAAAEMFSTEFLPSDET